MPSDTTPPLPHGTRLYSAVDRSNETYEPSPHAPRRTIPSGEVSLDGKRAWPKPSLTSRILVYGGMGVVAAAVTAGAVMAVRAVVDSVTGDDEDDAVEAARQRARARRSGGPRPPQLGPRRSQAMGFAGGGGGGDRRADQDRAERMRREAARRRSASSQDSGSLVDAVNDTVDSVTGGVRDVLATVTAAIEGFRSVAAQAGDVMADFNRTADQVKAMIEPATPKGRTDKRRAEPGSYARPAKKDVVDLREDESDAQDTRSHRL